MILPTAGPWPPNTVTVVWTVAAEAAADAVILIRAPYVKKRPSEWVKEVLRETNLYPLPLIKQLRGFEGIWGFRLHHKPHGLKKSGSLRGWSVNTKGVGQVEVPTRNFKRGRPPHTWRRIRFPKRSFASVWIKARVRSKRSIRIEVGKFYKSLK